MGFENDLDWSKCPFSKVVYEHAKDIKKNKNMRNKLELFEITNQGFYEKMCDNFMENKIKDDEATKNM